MANVNSNTPARPENEGHNLNLNATATPMPPSAHSRILSLHTLCEGPITAKWISSRSPRCVKRRSAS